MEDFVYCWHALGDGNQRIRIREKTLEFSSTVLPAPSPNPAQEDKMSTIAANS